MRASLVAALVLTSALAVGCGEDFPPYNRLTSTRVLAIAAEPPTPGPGETTTIRAFSYIPEVGAGFDLPGVTYSWSWCPFPSPDGSGKCELEPAFVAMLAQAGIPLDLGHASSAQFTHSIPVELLAALCERASAATALFDCQGGFPITIRVTTTFTGPTVSPTGTDQIVTVSTVRLRFSAKHEPNVSPVIEGLQAERGEDIFPIGVEPAALLPRDEATVIRALVPESSIEKYTGTNNAREETTVRERLDLSWFVETGNTEAERTTYFRNVDPNDPETLEINPKSLGYATDNEWTPGKVEDYAKNRAHIIVIVRDNRGGMAVRDGFVNLEEGP